MGANVPEEVERRYRNEYGGLYKDAEKRSELPLGNFSKAFLTCLRPAESRQKYFLLSGVLLC